MSNIPELKIRVLKQELIDWKSLHWVQGNLKQMTESQCEKLTHSVLTKNILKAFHVWEHDGKLWCLDGNHLKKVLELIEQKKLAKIPAKLPADFIDCENEQEAADCVLTYSAVYTSIIDEGLYEFIHTYELQDDIPDLIKRIEIPGYDLQRFAIGYLEDFNYQDENEAWKGMPEFEQNEANPFHSINVHFNSLQDIEDFAKLIDQNVTDKTKYIWYPKLKVEHYGDVITNES